METTETKDSTTQGEGEERHRDKGHGLRSWAGEIDHRRRGPMSRERGQPRPRLRREVAHGPRDAVDTSNVTATKEAVRDGTDVTTWRGHHA
jgi:hypothetical protein